MSRSAFPQQIFKRKSGRNLRAVHMDGNFRRGMRYTDSFLGPGTVKLLVNHRIMDAGTYITPRLGIKGKDTQVMNKSALVSGVPAPHAVFYGIYRDTVLDEDRYGNVVVSFGAFTDPNYKSYFTGDVELNGVFAHNKFVTVTVDGVTHVAFNDLIPARANILKKEPKPIFTVFNHSLYYLAEQDAAPVFCKVNITRNGSGFSASSEVVTAKDVPLTEATSIGFNMLSANPFGFANQSSLTLGVLGILPYNANNLNNLMLSCNLGETVRFVMYYRYVTGAKYKVKWEYSVLGSGDWVILQDYSTVYNAGDSIYLDVQAKDSKFSLRATVTPWVANALAEDLSKEANYLVYETGIGTSRDLSQNPYNLYAAKGIATHNDMLVLWGVPGADTALFFSDPLDATYFPFPTNTYNFTDEILRVLPYSGALLVFTENNVYIIEGGPSIFEMSYPRSIFASLSFTLEDIQAAKVIKDMVFLRSSGKYYTLVPNIYTSGVADMRMVPISDPIEDLLFNWKGFLNLLSDRLYKFDVSWMETTRIKEYDFFNYVDGSSVKNVHRFVVWEDKDVEYYRYQIDVILVFNTETGVWTVEVASFPYTGLIAQGSTLYTTYVGDKAVFLQKMNYTNKNCIDEYNTLYYGTAINDTSDTRRKSELDSLPSSGTVMVNGIIDGDTVDLALLGRTRMLWIDTPESTTVKEPFGIEATLHLSNLIPVGSAVDYFFDGERVDKYGRALAWLRIGDRLVQALMAEEGYVKSIYDFGASNTTFINQVSAAIEQAKANKKNLYANIQPDGPTYIRNRVSAELLGNFQILDTGNRDHSTYIEKRYKEIQFMISNDSSSILHFFTDFFVDSQKRRSAVGYSVEQNLDESSQDYGTIYVTEVEEPNIEVANETELGFWEMDMSEFPQIDIVKVVFRVSGKGHYPRFVLVSRNQVPYKIVNYAWVYRTMNAR